MTGRSNKRRRSENPPSTDRSPVTAQPHASIQSRNDNILPTKRRNRQKEDKQEQEALDPAAVTPVTSVPTSVTEQQGPGQDSVEHGKQINDSQYQKQQKQQKREEAPLQVDESVLPSELSCPVCYEPFVEPIDAPCGHTFCRIDIEHLFRIRRPDDISRSFLCSRHANSVERVRPCPMCRQPFTLSSISPNEHLESQVKTQYPHLYEERKKEVEAAYERLSQFETHNLWLVVGNSHNDLGNTRYETSRGRSARMQHRHEWEFYVRLVGNNNNEDGNQSGSEVEINRFIESVTVQLHPTFSPSTVTLTEAPFQVRRVGWGTFGISAEIKFKPQWHRSPLSVFWMLQFDQDDSRIAVPMEFETSPNDSAEDRAEEGATVLINPGEIGGWRSVLMGLLISPYSWSESDDEEWHPDQL
jgi:hypothetical protein